MMSEAARNLSLEGRWEIVSAEGCDAGDLHAETAAFLEFRPTGDGDFHFGYVRGSMEYRVCERDSRPAAEFSFDGHEGAEPLCGSGCAVLFGDQLEVTLHFHSGRDAKLEARACRTDV